MSGKLELKDAYVERMNRLEGMYRGVVFELGKRNFKKAIFRYIFSFRWWAIPQLMRDYEEWKKDLYSFGELPAPFGIDKQIFGK